MFPSKSCLQLKIREVRQKMMAQAKEAAGTGGELTPTGTREESGDGQSNNEGDQSTDK